MPNDTADHLLDAHWDLLWRIRLSALYHRKRERFLDGLDRFSKAVTAIAGGAAFAQLRANPDLGVWITGGIVIVSTLSLVYGIAGKARRHAQLASDFKRLEAEVVMQSHSLSDDQLAQFESRLVSLEVTEPPALGALVTHCHNELATSTGHSNRVTQLPLYQSLLKNWFDFDQSMPKQGAQ